MKHVKHIKHNEIKTLLKHDINVLVSGPAASGKSTTIIEACNDLGYTLKFISCSQQMTVSHLLGFMSVNGTYIRTQFRDAIEHGYVFLLDEIDAASPNTLLVLNSIESGRVSFPDEVVEIHTDFRLCATANTIDSDNHSSYTGRNTLDEATLSRFDIIRFELDPELEKSLVSEPVYKIISFARAILEKYNDPKVISMRDSIRYEKRAQVGLADKYYEKLLGYNDTYISDVVELLNPTLTSSPSPEQQVRASSMKQSEAATLDELWSVIISEAKSKPRPEEGITSREDALKIAKDIFAGKPRTAWVLTQKGPTDTDPYSEGYILTKHDGTEIFTFTRDEIEIPF